MRAHDLLDDSQRNAIVQTIVDSCNSFREYEKAGHALFYEPYAAHRRRHTVTHAVLSAFAPDRLAIPNTKVIDLSYGRGMMQPELTTQKAIIHIKSHATSTNTNDVKENCRTHNADLDTPPVFAQIIFKASTEGILHSIDVVLYDSEASKVDSARIFSKAAVT